MFSQHNLLRAAALFLVFQSESLWACPVIPDPFTMCTHEANGDRYYIVGQPPKVTAAAKLNGNWIAASFSEPIIWIHRDLGSVLQLEKAQFLTTGLADNGRERILFLQDYNAGSMTMKEPDIRGSTKNNLVTLKLDFLNKDGVIVGSGEWAIQPKCGRSQRQDFIDLSSGAAAASITSVRITGRGGNWLGNAQCFQ